MALKGKLISTIKFQQYAPLGKKIYFFNPISGYRMRHAMPQVDQTHKGFQ